MNAIPTSVRVHDAMEMVTTRHAEARIRQRGFRERDLDVLLRFGREMPDGTWALADDDVDKEIDTLKRRIAMLDRLRGMTAVLDGERVVTVYKASRRGRRRHPLPEC